MKTLKAAAAPQGLRQLSLLFDTKRLAELSTTDRNKVKLVLAQILLQAAGLIVEELGDDRR